MYAFSCWGQCLWQRRLTIAEAEQSIEAPKGAKESKLRQGGLKLLHSREIGSGSLLRYLARNSRDTNGDGASSE